MWRQSMAMIMRDVRTSTSSPLRIDAVGIGQTQIGMTICPGKRGDSQYGIAWDHDLAADINAMVPGTRPRL